MDTRFNRGLEFEGLLSIEHGPDRFRLEAAGRRIVLHAPTLAALRRAVTGKSGQALAAHATSGLSMAKIQMDIVVGGQTVATLPHPANLLARALGLSSGRVFFWAALRALLA